MSTLFRTAADDLKPVIWSTVYDFPTVQHPNTTFGNGTVVFHNTTYTNTTWTIADPSGFPTYAALNKWIEKAPTVSRDGYS